MWTALNGSSVRGGDAFEIVRPPTCLSVRSFVITNVYARAHVFSGGMHNSIRRNWLCVFSHANEHNVKDRVHPGVYTTSTAFVTGDKARTKRTVR